MDQRVAVDLRGRSEEEAGLLRHREPERVVGPERTDLEGLDRKLQVVDGRGGGGEVEDRVERPFHRDELRHVVPDEPEPFLSLEVRDVAQVPGHEVVHGEDLVALGQEPVAEVAPQEAGSSGHQDSHARVREP
jgi:hypothetical protein